MVWEYIMTNNYMIANQMEYRKQFVLMFEDDKAQYFFSPKNMRFYCLALEENVWMILSSSQGSIVLPKLV